MTFANLLMRVSYGRYDVTNSFFEKACVTRLQTDNFMRSDTPFNNGAMP